MTYAAALVSSKQSVRSSALALPPAMLIVGCMMMWALSIFAAYHHSVSAAEIEAAAFVAGL